MADITLINDQSQGFIVDWFLPVRGQNKSAVFPPRPPGIEQMTYANACVSGEIEPQDLDPYFFAARQAEPEPEPQPVVEPVPEPEPEPAPEPAPEPDPIP